MLPLPAPLEVDWSWKAVTSAVTELKKSDSGSLELTIEHELIRGITTEMLAWWFQHLDRDVDWQGGKLHAYRLWHPRDHVRIDFTRDRAGRITPGQRIHIQEMFARDPRYTVDEHPRIHRWDRYGIGFHVDILGTRMFELNHQFEDVPGGVQYRSRARIGAFRGLVGGVLNRVVIPGRFGEEKARAWFTHNVEEVGCFEHFLPQLFAAR